MESSKPSEIFDVDMAQELNAEMRVVIEEKLNKGQTKRKIGMKGEIQSRKTPTKTSITLIQSLPLLLLPYKKTCLLGKNQTRKSMNHSLIAFLKDSKNLETTYQTTRIQSLLIICRAISHSSILSIQQLQLRKTLQSQRKSSLLPENNPQLNQRKKKLKHNQQQSRVKY